MNCKDCIHSEVCPVWDSYNDRPYKEGYRGFCNNYDKFKDKSRFIELPCKVGNEIWCVSGRQIYKAKVHCISCGGRVSTDWQFHIYDYDKDNACVLLKNYKEDWFLTKEEAEAKLKELNGNERY